jgi:hypothetical protein
MMSGMMFALIAALAASFFVDILGFVFRTLPNFLRRAKIKKSPNPHYEALATMLKDMESHGLVKLKSGLEGKRQAKDQHNTSMAA